MSTAVRLSLVAACVILIAYIGVVGRSLPEKSVAVSLPQASVAPSLQIESESALRERVTRFYESWKRKDIGAIWELLAPSIRTTQEPKVYREEYGRFFENVTLIEYSIKNTSFPSRASAVVQTALILQVKDESRQLAEIDRTQWVLIADGQWYYGGAIRDSEANRKIVSEAGGSVLR